MLKKILNLILFPYKKYKEKKEIKKRLKILRNQDPYLYK